MTTLDRPRVLVVDDGPAVLGWAMLVLRGAGYRVAGAADGREAQRAIRERPTDLVLLDLAMPEMDGPGLLAWLRRVRPDLPVVIISSADRARAAAAAYEAAGHLDKPFSEQRLIATVRQHLHGAAHSGSR